MDHLTRIEIECEAMRYCTMAGIDDHEGYDRACAAMAQQAYMRAVQPFIKAKADLLRFEMPVYIKHADGRLEVQPPKRTEQLEQALKLIDEMIAREAARYTPEPQLAVPLTLSKLRSAPSPSMPNSTGIISV